MVDYLTCKHKDRHIVCDSLSMADDLLKKKMNPLQFPPYGEHKKFSDSKPNWLIVFTEVTAVCLQTNKE